MTAFRVGDRVRMGAGAVLRVVDVDERLTPFGNFVTYWVAPADDPGAAPEPVVNGHLRLSRVP